VRVSLSLSVYVTQACIGGRVSTRTYTATGADAEVRGPWVRCGRAVRALASLLALLRGFPVDSPLHPDLFDRLEQARAKFRLVATLLGSSVRYTAAAPGGPAPLSF
jgi:hypothetical protein